MRGLRTVDYDEASTAALLPATTRLGPATLIVTDLNRSAEFYAGVVGIDVQWRGELATGEEGLLLGSEGVEPVLRLIERPAARPASRTAGLYHVALRYPDRPSLAHVVRRIAEQRVPIQGLSDHGTHEAIYLPDPDGNGLELETDRPREQWPPMAEEFSRGGPAPLNVDDLLATTEGAATASRAEGVDMGHLHLHVRSTDEAEAFYRDVIGFSLIAALPTAIFMSAGGYHHHLGANVWNGVGVPPAAADAVGLHSWSIVVPDEPAIDAVVERAARAGYAQAVQSSSAAVVLRDPSGTAVEIETEAARSEAPAAVLRPTPPVSLSAV